MRSVVPQAQPGHAFERKFSAERHDPHASRARKPQHEDASKAPSTMTTQVSLGKRPSWSSGHLRRSVSESSSRGGLQSKLTLDKLELSRNRGTWERLKERSRQLCDSWRFCVLTTVLTVYALFGDDFRLAVTHQPTDNLFNAMTILCILVFTTEVLAACVGKDGYFLGFFFFLDLGATVTLLFDLTWVWNEMACTGATGGTGPLRSSRAGRAGARAARTVRIIRLIRLVKVYKTYKTAIDQKDGGRQKDRTEKDAALPGEGDDDDLLKEEDPDEDAPLKRDGNLQRERDGGLEKNRPPDAETRVGKKLSDMTTRRVIILVLVMLFIMPCFLTTTVGYDDLPTSGAIGAELIYDRLRSWCLTPYDTSPWCLQSLVIPQNELKEERYAARAWYEKYLLSYIYYHHSPDFAWKLSWLGLNSASLAQRGGVDAAAYLGELAQLDQLRFLGPYASPDSRLTDWDRHFEDANWQVNVGGLPDSVRQKLVKPWTEQCLGYYGVSVSFSFVEADPTLCSLTEELRCSEVQTYFPLTKSMTEGQHLTMMFAFDTRGTTQLEAGLSMLQTIFICFAVGLGALSFSNDANKLLLNPIERMIAKMETIKDNPLEAMRLGDREFRLEEIEMARRKEQFAKKGKCWKWMYLTYQKNKVKEPMETVILEKTIIKLGGLLALGFGEAGAEIIGQNMRGGHSAGVNAMVPGQKVDAIIGFCNIRNFTHATEVLKQKVMVFVNQIGEIVHGCVDDYHGAPNKNIGDCFLCVWRLSGAEPERQTKLADMAVMSFIRILAEINKSRVLAVYREHPGLLQRIPKYRVQMGFGLHCGWAIEGAIGSEFKIDASYLSPNVNVASRLEAATEHFGVCVLISHFMINLCSQQMAAFCRVIDHVTVNGSKQPVRLSTIDLDHMQLPIQKKRIDKLTKGRFKIRQIREARKNEKWIDDYKVWEAFHVDEDLISMRSRYSAEFFQRFSMAYRNYEAGEWMVARDMLLTCHYSPNSSVDGPTGIGEEEWPVDGPTTTLLRFMKQSHYYPPHDWPGHRELSEK